jgi:hypothetical protein
MLCTWSGRMVPPLFSATNSRRFEAEKPKVASRANSVSPTGCGSPPTRAARLQVGRDQQHAVVPASEHLPTDRVQRGDLGDDVPAQRRVTAADHVDRGVEPPAQLEQRATEAGVQGDGVGLAHAAGVGEDEAGRAGPVEAGSDLVGVEDGHDGDVVHRL